MFGFADYFDIEKQHSGFTSADEEIREHLFLLDMMLEHYLDAKTQQSEGMIFSRGMKMTEEEIESYYFAPPRTRISVGYDADFADEVKKAVSYLATREAAGRGNDGEADEGATGGHTIFLPLKSCRERFSLSDEEWFALLLAFAVQVDMKYTRLFGYLSNEPTMQYPTLGVFYALWETVYPEDAANAVARLANPNGTLMRFCIDRTEIDKVKRPFLHTPLVLHGTLLSYMLGNFAADENGEPVKPAKTTASALPASYKRMADRLLQIENNNKSNTKTAYYYIECEDGGDVRSLLSSLADAPLFVLDMDAIFGNGESDVSDETLEKQLSAFCIRAKLQNGRIAVYSVNDDNIAEQWKKITATLDFATVIWLYGEAKMPEMLLHGKMATPIKLPLPDTAERKAVWQTLIEAEHLNLENNIDPEILADTYAFSYTRIKEIVKQAKRLTETDNNPAITREKLLSVIFRYNAAHFANLATQVRTAYTWDDIEIAEPERKRLLIACNRYRYKTRIDERYGVAKRNAYGNGVSLLLYGAPGTGKTMAAQVVANELGLPLYRVDVSRIFSKYIGETEKNLGQIFEEAKRTNVILFFDEADALFAKRTEVGDANDRYANAETAYLLQKVEEHNGMTILATNLYHNFDTAFVRRITFVVHIDSPNESTRLRLWQHTLPETMPFEKSVDFDFLAENFELSGSNIKAILHTAAYMAGKDDRPIAMADLITALRFELEKLGRIIDSSDFGNYGVYL